MLAVSAVFTDSTTHRLTDSLTGRLWLSLLSLSHCFQRKSEALGLFQLMKFFINLIHGCHTIFIFRFSFLSGTEMY